MLGGVTISRWRLVVPAVIVVLGSVGLGAAALAPLRGGASSHREAPYIATDPEADNTDLYAFRSPDRPGRVTFIANWVPLEEPAGGPNFHGFGDDVRHYIKIDNDGDARADILYRFDFETDVRHGNTFLYNTGPVTTINDTDLNVRQFYRVVRIKNGNKKVLGRHVPVPPVNIGPRSTPNYAPLAAAGIKTLGARHKVFAGPRDEAFTLTLDRSLIFWDCDRSMLPMPSRSQSNPASTAPAVSTCIQSRSRSRSGS